MSQKKKIITNPKLKKFLLTSLIIVVVGVATVGGISFYLFGGDFNINFESNITDIDPQDMGVEEFLEDFEYMYNFLADNYPYFDMKERQFGYNWLDLKEGYLARIRDCENTTEFLNVILDAILSLQNIHTYLVNPSYTSTQRGYFVEDDRYPYYEIFSEEVVEANHYWIDIFNNLHYQRDSTFFGVNKVEYNLLMVYDRGDYIVHEVWNDTDADLLGSKVIAVDGLPIHDLILKTYENLYLFKDFARDRNYVEYLRPVLLDFSTDFTFENSTGGLFNATVSYDSTISYSSMKWRGYYPDLPVVSTRRFPNEQVGYMQVGGMDNPEPYRAQIMSFYQTIADYDHLIIDIRGNPGGNDNFWNNNIVEPLLKEKVKATDYYAFHDNATYSHMMRKEREVYFTVSKSIFDHLPPEVQSDDVKIYKKPRVFRPENSVEFDGTISVLIDKIIYSSSESFSAFCKNTGFATLYGTSTGGDGIGDATYFTLPNSKLIIRYSYILGLFSNGDANEETHTTPDVYYESAAGSWDELIDFTINDLIS